jgi:tRNA A-37 threonylcarbamoyl transferase component Bud32
MISFGNLFTPPGSLSDQLSDANMPKRFFPNLNYVRHKRSRWCYVDQRSLAVITSLRRDLPRILRETPPPATSNIAFPYEPRIASVPRVFVKIYKVRHRKDRIRETLGRRHRHYGLRYGVAEFTNSLAIKERGVSCPDIFALGELSRGLLVDSHILVMEYLSGYRTLSDALRDSKTHGTRLDILKATQRAITDLFRQGIFHIDLNSKNIMLHPGKGEAYKIIDLEYVRFLGGPSDRVLSFQLGYLYRKWCREFVPDSIYESWVRGLLDSLLKHQGTNDLADLYENAKSRHFPRREILSLV